MILVLPARSALLVAGILLACTAAPLPAQDSSDARLPAGAIAGSVVDAETARPLAGATVVLQPEEAGTLPGSDSGGSAFLSTSRSTVSGPSGTYRFGGLPPGRYRLYVERAGYRPVSIAVDLRGSADSRVSIGLSVTPIPLQPIEVTTDTPDAYGRSRQGARETESGRLAALRLRQQASLATDARELTHADVVEAVTLGETDLFRALHRLPGVSTRDDYSAELWTRGASWDQTRVYFDGLPLFNPVHAVGAFSGVSPNAVGAAWLHPGVRSAALGEGAAGVLDIRSRRGTGEGELNGHGELSLLSSSLALDQRILDGRGAWMLSGRRTYLDWLTRALGSLADDPEIHLPYAFSDLAGRFDLSLDEDRSLEVSGIWERDRFSGDMPDVLHGNSATWGNAAGRVTYEAPLHGLRARHTAGVSRYAAVVQEVESNPDLPYSAPSELPSRNTLLYSFVGSEFEPRGSAPSSPWSGGYQLILQSASYEGPQPALHRYQQRDSGVLSRSGSLAIGALWAERTWRPVERFRVQTGLRMEAGQKVQSGGVLRPAPRLSARYQVTPELALSAGLGRTYQYAQAAASTGPHVLLSTNHLWVLAGEDTPALRSDIATLGAEAWLGSGWLAAANAYLRHSTGVAVADPTPGLLQDQKMFVFGDNNAHGVELSARRMVERWTGSAAYSYGVSEIKAEGLRFPSAEDRRHSLNATTMLRAGTSLRLGAAYTAMTGAPYTRVYSPASTCSGTECDDSPRVEAPNAMRTAPYTSLDLLVDWTRSFRRWDFGAYLQLRNVLGSDNSILYSDTSARCVGYGYQSPCPTRYELEDHFEMGIPTIPLIGFRVRF